MRNRCRPKHDFKLREECGVCGIFGHPEAANLAYLSLYSLQHRGQEGAGIVSSDGDFLYSHRQLGHVAEIFNEKILKDLPGHIAIGHNRYSTMATGKMLLKNIQPFVVELDRGPLALAHNGNLVNAMTIREELQAQGSIFQSLVDSEVLVHLTARAKGSSLVERLIAALAQVRGAYSLVAQNERELIAARDPYGFRPLVLGRLEGGMAVASETCALDLIEADYLREVEPGEVLVISPAGVESFKVQESPRRAHCIFEYIYFARPDSLVFGKNVYAVRKELGRQLAREHPAEVDMVIPVPDSGVPAAIGYAHELGVPFELGMIRNHYVGRTFIEPQQSIRNFGVKVKLNAVRDFLSGKRVVVVDDSIVRGTTSRKIVRMVRAAGAKEVHLRISSPWLTHPCFYGVDTPTRQELIGASHTVTEINQYVTSDTLGYLSLDGLYRAVGGKKEDYCVACFTGNYPIEFFTEARSPQLTLFEI